MSSTLLPSGLRQEYPFRYINSPVTLVQEEKAAYVRLAADSIDPGTFGWIANRLAGFLVVEALAQLSGLLIRGAGLGSASQIGFLVSVDSGAPLNEWYDIEKLALRSQFTSRVSDLLTFACTLTPAGQPEQTLQLQIGLHAG